MFDQISNLAVEGFNTALGGVFKAFLHFGPEGLIWRGIISLRNVRIPKMLAEKTG